MKLLKYYTTTVRLIEGGIRYLKTRIIRFLVNRQQVRIKFT